MKRKLAAAAVLVILAGAALYWKKDVIRGISSSSAEGLPSADRLYTVRNMDFRIVLNEQGTLKSKDSTKIKVPHFQTGRTKLTWLIEDGARVKKGERIAEFEKGEIENRITKKKEELVSLHKKLELSGQLLELEKEREEVKWKSSEKAYEQAIKNREKYIDLEAPKKYADLEVSIKKAEDKVESARNAMSVAQEKVSEELFVDDKQRQANEQNLRNKELQYKTALKQLESARLQMKIYRRHTHPEKLSSLDDAIQTKKMRLEDAKISAQSDINAAQHDVDRLKIQIRQTEKHIEKLKQSLEKTVLKAPAEGVVHIGDPRRRYSSRQIEVGAEVWRGRVIAHIPDVKNFQVESSIPENSRSRIRKGLEVAVTLPAVPGLLLKGTITAVAHKAHTRVSWDPSSPKAFNITIDVKQDDERLVSGMTARVEIFISEITGVRAVPVEAVFVEKDKNFVYRQTGGKPEKVVVTTGQSNEDFVAVQGVNEGDRVYLFNPFR